MGATTVVGADWELIKNNIICTGTGRYSSRITVTPKGCVFWYWTIRQCSGCGSGLDPDSIGSVDPDSSRPKLSPKKGKKEEI